MSESVVRALKFLGNDNTREIRLSIWMVESIIEEQNLINVTSCIVLHMYI